MINLFQLFYLYVFVCGAHVCIHNLVCVVACVQGGLELTSSVLLHCIQYYILRQGFSVSPELTVYLSLVSQLPWLCLLSLAMAGWPPFPLIFEQLWRSNSGPTLLWQTVYPLAISPDPQKHLLKEKNVCVCVSAHKNT